MRGILGREYLPLGASSVRTVEVLGPRRPPLSVGHAVRGSPGPTGLSCHGRTEPESLESRALVTFGIFFVVNPEFIDLEAILS